MKEDEGDDDGDGSTGTGSSRYPTLPSLVALQHMRNRSHMAHDGLRLMKWSAMATGRELRKVVGQLDKVYGTFGEDVRNAFIALARCRYFYPNLNKMVLENTANQACVTVGKSVKSVAGCKLNIFQIERNCPDSYPHLGIDKGGKTIEETKRLWYELLVRVISIDQLRSNFENLDESHRNSNKKANILGKIIIPRTKLTIQYILSELEELEREEFFRMKKILDVKNKNKKKKAAEKGREVAPVSKPLSLPSPLPVKKSFKCIHCGGDMHPTILTGTLPLSEEERKRANAAIADLKESLSKVLNATENYEKTTSTGDNIKEFKANTSELKARLQPLPPKSTPIPDNVNFEELCDICKEEYKRSQEKCIICGAKVHEQDVKKLAAMNESRQQLQKQVEIALHMIKDYESKGFSTDKIKEFKETASKLKLKLDGPSIPCDVDLNKLCMSCKERHSQQHVLKNPGKETPSQKAVDTTAQVAEPKVCIKEPNKEKKIQKVKEIVESITQSPAKSPTIPMKENQVSTQESRITTMSSEQETSNVHLGVFETEEITEVIQVRNTDGTVSEKRRVVTIVRKIEDRPSVSQRTSRSCSFKDHKSVGLVSVIQSRRSRNRCARSAKSESTVTLSPMADRVIRECLSSTFGFGLKEHFRSDSEHNEDSDVVISRKSNEEISNGSESTSGNDELFSEKN